MYGNKNAIKTIIMLAQMAAFVYKETRQAAFLLTRKYLTATMTLMGDVVITHRSKWLFLYRFV